MSAQLNFNAASPSTQNRQTSNAANNTHHDATLPEAGRFAEGRNTHHDGEEFQLDI